MTWAQVHINMSYRREMKATVEPPVFAAHTHLDNSAAEAFQLMNDVTATIWR